MVKARSDDEILRVQVSTFNNNACVGVVNSSAVYVDLAKGYAQQAEQSAQIASQQVGIVEEASNQAQTGITTSKNEAMEEVETLKADAVSQINTTSNTAINNINTAGSEQVNLVEQEGVEAINNITTQGNTIITTATQQADRAEAALEELQGCGLDMLPLYHNFYSAEDMTSTGAYVNASLGAYLSGNVYSTAYNDLVQKLGQQFCLGLVKSFGDSSITDYDVVVNQNDMTFRLPLLNGSENIKGDSYQTLTLGASGSYFTAPANGLLYLRKKAGAAGQYIQFALGGIAPKICSVGTEQIALDIELKKGESCRVEYSAAEETKAYTFTPAIGNGNLYFKLSNVIQNQQVLDAAGITAQLNEQNAASRGYLVEKYENIASWYRVYSDGWCEQGARYSGANTTVTLLKTMKNAYYSLSYSFNGNSTNTINLNAITYSNKTESSFLLRNTSGVSGDWEVKGYIA